MSDDKPENGKLRQLLKDGSADPRLLARYDLFAEFRAAMQRGDKNTQIKIAQRLKVNAQEILAAKEQAAAAIDSAIADATATTDPDQRTAKLLKAFELAVKTRYWAYDAMGDIEAGNAAADKAYKTVQALDATPPGRRSALIVLLDSPNVAVRAQAAIQLRKIMPERINPILRQIYEEERGTSIGFSVMQVLPDDPNEANVPSAQAPGKN